MDSGAIVVAFPDRLTFSPIIITSIPDLLHQNQANTKLFALYFVKNLL
jgi:hypothetical protein